MNPQKNNYDFILNDAPNNGGGGFSQKQRIIQVIIAALILLLVFGVLYMVLIGGKKSDSEKLLPVYGSLLDIKAVTELGIKETKNTDLLNKSATNLAIVNSQINDLSKYVDKKVVSNKNIMAAYRNDEYVKSLADAKQNGTYDTSYNAILANRVDAHKQIIVTAYSQTGNDNIKKMLDEFNTQIAAANGEQTTPTKN